ncbi:MAG: ABC-2 family transporter protein [Patescibacteria group bacterium]
MIDLLAYRYELAMSLLAGVLIFTGQFIFWRVVFTGQTEIRGFTFNQILLYYLFLSIVADLVNSNVGFNMSNAILKGTITNYLLRPFNIRFWLLTEELSRTIFNLLIRLVSYLSLYILVFGSVQIDVLNLILFLGFIILVSLLSFCIYFLIGCLAFFTEEIKYVNFGLRRTILFLAGGVLPLSFFPDWYTQFLNFTPLKYLVDFPVKILFGKINTTDLLLGILVTIFWIIFLWFVGGLLFDRTVKANQSVGI